MDRIPELPEILKDKKVCLVTDWLTNLGGGERVLKAIADLFPLAPIFTTVVDRENIGDFAKRDIRTSFLQNVPVLHRKQQYLLPLLPRAIESLDVSEYDVVLSFSSFGAKSVKTGEHQKHICYLHTPVRYAWEPDFDPRVKSLPFFMRPMVKRSLETIKKWDYDTRHRPDLYIANSSTTKERVKQYYDMDVISLYPPVEAHDFFLADKKDFYLAAGRMVPYKKFELIAKTFARMRAKSLVIIGDGPEARYIRALSIKCPNINVLGYTQRANLARYMAEAKAFILPQKEDAGIIQLEAMASGTPVVAYKAGGALDVVQQDVNGVFFEEQTEESLMNAIFEFDKKTFDPVRIRETALPHDTKKFQGQYLTIVEEELKRL